MDRKAVCPRCGSEDIEPAKEEKGAQHRCRKCGYTGPLPAGLF
jgi:predicted RNA-binding Zn-ribbon protein involved in translation (DUF1610 family)